MYLKLVIITILFLKKECHITSNIFFEVGLFYLIQNKRRADLEYDKIDESESMKHRSLGK